MEGGGGGIKEGGEEKKDRHDKRFKKEKIDYKQTKNGKGKKRN
jgi:hypothetical protein